MTDTTIRVTKTTVKLITQFEAELKRMDMIPDFKHPKDYLISKAIRFTLQEMHNHEDAED